MAALFTSKIIPKKTHFYPIPLHIYRVEGKAGVDNLGENF